MSENGKLQDDGRLCVHQHDLTELRNFRIDRIEMTIVEAGSVFRQVESFLRFILNGGTWNRDSVIDDFKVWPDEPTDDRRLCIVWNPNTNQVQFSAIGMNLFEAEIAAHNGALYMDILLVDQKQVWNDFYGVRENGGADNS